MERKLFTALQGDTATRLNDGLSKQGFRRSQNVLYRPACSACSACMSARIRIADFSFFDPDFDRDSLGTYIILDHIQIAKDLGLPYVYLGYWVPGSPKMDYKSKFSGLEVYHQRDWEDLQPLAHYGKALQPEQTDPIAEQVAQIALPDGRPISSE